jgi:hypothetical protein
LKKEMSYKDSNRRLDNSYWIKVLLAYRVPYLLNNVPDPLQFGTVPDPRILTSDFPSRSRCGFGSGSYSFLL